MNYLFPIISSFLLLFLLPEKTVTDHELLKNLLYDFLEGASVNDYDVHNRFWADDLIYTSAAGERIGKQDIMSGLTVGNTDINGNFPQYYADEIQINIYGEAAVVAFILVADIPLEPSGNEQILFYNTGTFLKRDGEWRAVAWQATRIPD